MFVLPVQRRSRQHLTRPEQFNRVDAYPASISTAMASAKPVLKTAQLVLTELDSVPPALLASQSIFQPPEVVRATLIPRPLSMGFVSV